MLYTNVERKRKHLTNFNVCVFCNDNLEIMLHVLCDCMMEQSVWREAVVKKDMLNVFCAMSYEVWLDLIFIMDVNYVLQR
ncbi:hypothetical protein GQ457_07G042980 [Hibiscus cannabinus]